MPEQGRAPMKKTGGTAAGLAVVLALLLVLLPGQAQYQARASSSDTTSRAALAGMSVLDRLVHAPGGFFSLVSATGDNSTVTEPDISVSPAAIDFGTVVVGTSSPAQTVTITNSGTANLTIGTANISGDSAAEFHIESDNASQQTLAPSVNATIQIVFSPVSGGTKSATLSIPSNDPDQPTASVSLSGVGAIPPAPPPAPSPP
ncbi:MAG: choice-of-anchor D domain-containing protein, partial [Chloroflexi bacterium]|nr:choice-of-anchor D domain-containing protein [Chloroflexota bacterium]